MKSEISIALLKKDIIYMKQGIDDIKGSLNCMGGTKTTSGNYTIHTFTSSGTFVCNPKGATGNFIPFFM